MGSLDPTRIEKTLGRRDVSYHRMYWPAIAALSLALSVSAEEDQILQDDPCLARSKVVGDVQYCDRYWECEFGQPELYDCPNGLVWVGKNQGIADGVTIPGDTPIFVKTRILPITPKARSTVTGCTEYSGTRPPAPATGPAGTEPPQSSSALVDCSTTRRLTPVTGLRMLLAARNILCAKMMPTVTFPLESPVTGIGPAKEDTPGCRGAPPCWSLIRTGDAA